MEEEIKTKVCSNSNCIHGGKPQPITNFNRASKEPDGYRYECKDCRKKETKKQNDTYRLEHADSIREQKRRWRNKLALYDTWCEKLKNYDEYQRDSKNFDLLQMRCKYCGKWINPTNAQVSNRLQAINTKKCGETNIYCSDACKRDCPTYGQILYPKDFKQNTSREVQPELRKMVLERDNWTCQKCGKTKEEFPELELHCHHKYPLNEDPIGSADVDNCITLCKECHKWIHMNIPGCGYAEMKCVQ